MSEKVVLKAINICKEFGVTKANNNINLELKEGEIRGLIGENGSGKSTFSSIVAGIYSKTSGEMILDGEPYDPKSPLDALNSHVGVVVQEMGLVNDLSLEMNMFLSKIEDFRRFGILNTKKIHNEAEKAMKEWGFEGVNLTDQAGGCSVEVRKQVEIVRALLCEPKILILDEVTQALSHDTRDVLYKVIKRCKEKGIALLIISHDIEEIIAITDTLTVLRDGVLVGNINSADVTPNMVKQMMVGREINEDYYREDNEPDYEDEVVLKVDNLTSLEPGIENVSFELHKGEILACCGLSDGGIHELGKTLFGIMKHKEGTITVSKSGSQINNAGQAVANGLAYVPKDRDSEAMMLSASIKENFILPSIVDIKKALNYINESQVKQLTTKAIEDFDVKCTGMNQVINDLSGGNKQKVNLGRWISKGADIYVLDSPTRGVDVGVKAYIYHILKEIKASGKSVIMISDELPEAIGMADRILIMSDGKVKDVVSRGEEFSESRIIEVMI